jgi:hypothetical protein
LLKPLKVSQKFMIFLYAVAILLFCHHFIFRPIFLDWGSSQELRKIAFSGDTFTDGNRHTRAVLIEGTPEEIWPWIVQIGQDRGGFYSYQWLENIFGARMRNSYVIKSEFQFPRLQGDTIWLATKDHYGGEGYQVAAEIVPFKSFVMVGGADYNRIRQGEKASGSWALYLYPASSNTTWLVARSSDGLDHGVGNSVLRYFFFEVPHFIMERKMLKTVQTLVEKNHGHVTNETISNQ